MISYIPFLKMKRNEIIALAELTKDVSSKICPFFDFPKRSGSYTEDTFKVAVDQAVKSLFKHLDNFDNYYIDNYDLEDNLKVGGNYSYEYIIDNFDTGKMIPVVSLDRIKYHNQVVQRKKKDGTLKSEVVACRFTAEDFENYQVIERNIAEELTNTFNLFKSIDLILDCKVCLNLNSNIFANQILDFSLNFSNNFPTRRIIVTGSSIPASIAEIVGVNGESFVERTEIDIYERLSKKPKGLNFTLGDYTIISPNYSDVEIRPELFQNIIAAKILYTLQKQHYVIRGTALKTGGRAQYFDLAQKLCSKKFFRKGFYSLGDKYFEDKAKKIGNNCTPSTIVKPSINSHITYMVREFTR